MTSHPSPGRWSTPTTNHTTEGKTAVLTTEMNRQILRQRPADLPCHRAEQLRLLRESGHPPSRRRIAPRRGLAAMLAHAARRLDGETARRAVA